MATPRGRGTEIMSDARDVILGRVERALRTARIPAAITHEDADRDGSGDPEQVALPAVALPRTSLQERFVLEARALGVEIYVEPTSAAVCDRLRTLVAGLRVLSWNPTLLPYGCGAIVDGALLGSSPTAEQARAEIGVTACHGAIAETGSLALIAGPGCSPTVSLLPPVHVAIVRPEDLFESMGGFLDARAEAMTQSANCTFVTGPSRTGDIELSLTIGVHGPGRVAIVFGPSELRMKNSRSTNSSS